MSRAALGNPQADTSSGKSANLKAADLVGQPLTPTIYTVTSSANSGQSEGTKEESSCVHSLKRTHRAQSSIGAPSLNRKDSLKYALNSRVCTCSLSLSLSLSLTHTHTHTHTHGHGQQTD